MALNSLQVLRQSGVGIACDTPEYLRQFILIKMSFWITSILISDDKIEIRPFDSDAQDATTNPSLVFAAAIKVDYEHLIEEALRYAVPRRTNRDAQVDLAADYLVGLHIVFFLTQS